MDKTLSHVRINVSFNCKEPLTEMESTALINLFEEFLTKQLVVYHKPTLVFKQEYFYEEDKTL